MRLRLQKGKACVNFRLHNLISFSSPTGYIEALILRQEISFKKGILQFLRLTSSSVYKMVRYLKYQHINMTIKVLRRYL